MPVWLHCRGIVV